jgi:hypothetical protein
VTEFAAAMCEMRAMADQIHSHARDGAPLTLPIKAVHRQLVDEMGGTPAWEAMKADLAIAKEKLKW